MQQQKAIGERMDGALARIRDMVDANTMVGSPIVTADGITVIPVSRMSFGFASGAGDKNAKESCIWSGAGAAVKVDPVGFLVARDGHLHMMNIAPPAKTTADRVLDSLPEIMDRIEGYVDRHARKKNKEAGS